MEGEFKPAAEIGREERKREWVRYYSEKRIYEQLLQVRMLRDLPIHKVLEIGPYYGLVTAMLDNAGYEVTTLDRIAPSFARPARPHITMDLTAIEPERLAGFDCIMCCATLEHVYPEQAEAALRAFHAAGAPFVLISVPYQGVQLYLRAYLNGFTFKQHVSFKKFRALREFRFDPKADPYGHKWEIGYKGRSLRRFEAMLRDTGFSILRRDFSYPSYSVFHMLERGPR
ncbi:MAG: class I SAM-dependent methyltransferase [Alphaproteobacteria bacterium]